MLEIDCPEECQFLKAGREREVQDYAKHLHRLDDKAQERNGRVLQNHADVVARLEYALSRERILSHDLTDKDVTSAVDILLDTYRTEDKGVLYEKTSDDLRVEALRRELKTIIESLRNPDGTNRAGIVDPQNARLPLTDAIDCLEYIRSIAGSYLADRQSTSGYVDFLARAIPRKETRSSIIMP